MGNETYWKSDSTNVMVCKVVVSGSGHAVAKNYDRNALRDGDIGLEVRVDRGKVREMTPEQRTAAQAITREMSRELLASVGVMAEEETLRPGIVVQANDERHQTHYGVITSVKDHSITIREIDSMGRTSLSALPLARFVFEQVEGREGLEGLVLTLASLARVEGRGYVIGDITPEMARHAVSEEAAAELFANQIISSGTRLSVFGKLRRDDEWFLKLFEHTVDPELAKPIAERAQDERLLAILAVRYAEHQNLVERITDQRLLAQVAIQPKETRGSPLDSFVSPYDLLQAGKRAVERLQDQNLIREVLANANKHGVREWAMLKVDDDSILVDALVNNPQPDGRPENLPAMEDLVKLIGRLSAESVCRIVSNAKNDRFAVAAMRTGLASQEALLQRLQNGDNKSSECWRELLDRVLDRDVIIRHLEKYSDKRYEHTGIHVNIWRLVRDVVGINHWLLECLAEYEGPSHSFYWDVLNKIDDVSMLRRIAACPTAPVATKKQARERIKQLIRNKRAAKAAQAVANASADSAK